MNEDKQFIYGALIGCIIGSLIWYAVFMSYGNFEYENGYMHGKSDGIQCHKHELEDDFPVCDHTGYHVEKWREIRGLDDVSDNVRKEEK